MGPWGGSLLRKPGGVRGRVRRTLADIQGDASFRQAVESIRENPFGAAGGAAMADFTTLIDLITTTIAPDSWEDFGGAGAISSFPTGVFVDASGLLRPFTPSPVSSRLDGAPRLDGARRAAMRDRGNRNARIASPLRKVSLVRLERALQSRRAFGEQPDAEMHVLAGLHRLRYLLVYPDTGDLVVAGPAGDWHTDSQGRVVNTDTGEPVWRLDDLLVVWRAMRRSATGSSGAQSSRRGSILRQPRRLSTRGGRNRSSRPNVTSG